MRELNFLINGQTLKKSEQCDFSNIIAGTSGYLFASFNFDKQWDGFGKVAVFKIVGEEYPVILNEKKQCIIPSEVLGWDYFYVYVAGKKRNTFLTTNSIKVEQVRK